MKLPILFSKPARGSAAYIRREYYLYDRFDTARAAGAVNGTSAEPVGGARTVVDTNGKLTIANGLLTLATGGTGNMNPGIYEALTTRALGRVIKGTVTFTGGIGTFGGASANSSGTVPVTGFTFSTTNLIARVSAAIAPVCATIATATAYQCVLVLRTAGAFWFIKGGAFTSWTLLYTSIDGTANLYTALGASSASTTFVATADNFITPKQAYIPVPLQSDGMSATTTDGLGNPENNGTAGNAYDGVGTPSVAAGVRGFSALSGGGLGVSVLACSSSDVNIEVNVTRTAGSAGIITRRTDASNYIQCLHNGTNVIVSQVVAGSSTTLSTTAVTYSAGATMKFHVEGTAYRAFYNNTAAGTGTVPASTNTNHGIITNDLSGSFDNLVIWARSGHEGLNLL